MRQLKQRPQHAEQSTTQHSTAHKMAVCGAAVPSTVRMEPGLFTSWRICRTEHKGCTYWHGCHGMPMGALLSEGAATHRQAGDGSAPPAQKSHAVQETPEALFRPACPTWLAKLPAMKEPKKTVRTWG